MQRMVRTEDGSIAVMVAVLLPMLLVMVAAASGTLVVAGGERELQRAASAAATAAAAQMDVVSSAGVVDLLTLSGGGGSVVADACANAGDNLSGSPLLVGFSDDAGICNGSAIGGSATVTVTTEVDGLGSSITQIDSLLSGPDGLIPVDLLAPLGGVVPALDQLSVTALLGELLPSLVTPRVRVTAASTVDTPLGELLSPGSDATTIEATAVARRRLKNVIVLPTTDALCTLAVPFASGIPLIGDLTVPLVELTPEEIVQAADPDNPEGQARLRAALTDVIGALPLSGLTLLLLGGVLGIVDTLLAPLTAALGDLLGDDPDALMSNCTLDLNQPADVAAQELFLALDDVMASPLIGVLDGLGVPISCVLNGIIVELDDLIDPLGESEAAPTLAEIIQAAQFNNEPVLVYTAGLTTSTGIPLLDVVPVATGDLGALLAGDLDAITEVTGLNGLYRTSLIEESPFDEAPLQPGC